MSEASAEKLYPCPFCGSEAHWNPGESALVCVSCDAHSPANLELDSSGTYRVKEHALAENLCRAPDTDRGWQTPRTEVRCETCGAISVFDGTCDVSRCDFCGASAFVPYVELKQSLRPESVLAFKISEGEARESVRRWYGQRWLAPAELREKALTDTVRGLYIPYWTFDAKASVRWISTEGSAESAHGGDIAADDRETHFDDVLVPASCGLNHAALAALAPFPTHELKPYHPGFVSGWVVERYQLDLANAAVAGRQQMERQLRDRLARRHHGKIPQDLRCEILFSQQTFKLILVPVWVLNYLFRGEPYQVLVNGYTGAITGSFPVSVAKSSTATAAAIMAIGALAWILPVGVVLAGAIPVALIGWYLHRQRVKSLPVFSPDQPPTHA